MQERFETFTVLINRIGRNISKDKEPKIAAFNLKSTHVSACTIFTSPMA